MDNPNFVSRTYMVTITTEETNQCNTFQVKLDFPEDEEAWEPGNFEYFFCLAIRNSEAVLAMAE